MRLFISIQFDDDIRKRILKVLSDCRNAGGEETFLKALHYTWTKGARFFGGRRFPKILSCWYEVHLYKVNGNNSAIL